LLENASLAPNNSVPLLNIGTIKLFIGDMLHCFFLVGVDGDENELAILEFIHLLVETMDRHFGNVCELDIMFHLEKAHFMLEEMVMNGCIVETNKTNILSPIQLLDKAS